MEFDTGGLDVTNLDANVVCQHRYTEKKLGKSGLDRSPPNRKQLVFTM